MAERRGLTFEVREVAPRTLRFTGSDETLDRYRTVIKVDGWKLDEYRKNPVFLWCHDASQPPIGRAVAVARQTRADGQPALVFDIEFAPADTYPFADVVYKLFKGGFMRAVSVGFMPLKRREMTKEEREQYGSEGMILEENELYELSAVPVPGNPNALISELGLDAAKAELVTRAIAPEEKIDATDSGRVTYTFTTCTGNTWIASDSTAPARSGFWTYHASSDPVALADVEKRILARIEGLERKVDQGLAKLAEIEQRMAQLNKRLTAVEPDSYGLGREIKNKLDDIKNLFRERAK